MVRVYGLPIRLSGRQALPADGLRPMRLAIPADILEEIGRHLEAALPNEGCGMLATVPEGDALRAVRFYPGDNADASPHRYTMNPAAVLGALRDIDGRGWELGAIVHSHPAGPATPSVTDLAEAHYPDALMLIADLSGSPGEVRAWRIGVGREVIEATLEIGPRDCNRSG